jgi:Site-specific recombinase XerD
MEEQDLQTKTPILLSYLKEKGYSQIYIDRFRRTIKQVLKLKAQDSSITYADIYQLSVEKGLAASTLRHIRSILGLIEQFDIRGIFPEHVRTGFLTAKSYDLLSEEFRGAIDIFRIEEPKCGKKAETVYHESHNATTFFLALQKLGVRSFDQIEEKHILSVFKDYSCSYKKNVSAIIKSCIPFFREGLCLRVLSFFPELREKRRNIQYLTEIEISKIKITLTDTNSRLSLRDKAIGLLAMFTGLRGCDIAGLKFSNIDWNNDFIIINQQKTNVPLKLPLRAIVGNTIYDYICNERPRCRYEEIFITQTTPYKQLVSKGMNSVAKKIMHMSNIRQNRGDRKGLHVFRHHFATSLLKNDVPQPVISNALGHTSPDSIAAYLSADIVHLKECSLSIELYPIRKEVFDE